MGDEEKGEKIIETAKINSKGQITIPKDIREKLDMESGDRVFIQNVSGTVTVNKPDEEAYEVMAKVLKNED